MKACANWMTLRLMAAMTAVTLLGFHPLKAQDELTVKKAFEGKWVVLKIDMPATKDGVDVWPDQDLPVDYSKVAKRIKRNGAAIRAGEQEMITKVQVVKNHIEFQLGGGGYGTFADMLSSPYVPPPIPQTETAEEARLRAEISVTKDARTRRDLERRLSDLQRQRSADNAYAEAQVAQINVMAGAEDRERRLAAGSRFNIRWDKSVPPDAVTPEAIMQFLSEYVDFSPMDPALADLASVTVPGAGVVALRKGMTIEEVEQLLGPAISINTDEASGIEIMTRKYHHPEHKVVARFASGVLVDFAITPH